MAPSRLLFLSLSSRQFGGGEVYLLNLLRHFRQRHEVSVAAAEENGLMVERLRELGVPFRTFPLAYRHLPGTVRRLREWHRQEGFHLVHCNGRRSQLFGALLAGGTDMAAVGADLVATLSWTGSWPERLQNLAAALLNRVLAVPRLDRILVLTDHMRRESVRWLRVPADRIVTVSNAVDADDFSPRPRDEALAASLGIPPGAPVLACPARFVPHKGQALLVDAAALLEEVRVLLIGDGPDEARLRARVRDRGLEGRFVFMEFPRDLRPYLALSDVVVLPSFAEGLPTALLQGMAMERPVVGTDVQGIPEVVRPGENGWLFPAGRADLLAERLRDLLEHPGERARMGRQGRLRVLQDFSLPRMLERVEAVYEEALTARGVVAGSRGTA